MKDIKFVPQAPKTYEVRYLEVKEPNKISTITRYLGLSQVASQPVTVATFPGGDGGGGNSGGGNNGDIERGKLTGPRPEFCTIL